MSLVSNTPVIGRDNPGANRDHPQIDDQDQKKDRQAEEQGAQSETTDRLPGGNPTQRSAFADARNPSATENTASRKKKMVVIKGPWKTSDGSPPSWMYDDRVIPQRKKLIVVQHQLKIATPKQNRAS